MSAETGTDTRPKGPQSPQGDTEGATPAKQAGADQTPPTPPQTPPQGAGTLSGEPLKDVSEGRPQEGPELTGAGAVRKAAHAQKLGPKEQQAAVDWLLQADPDPGEVETKVLELNFGTSDEPKLIPWEIQPVGIDTMRRIREGARNTRKARRTGQVDETRMNLQVIVAGTRTPDVQAAATLAAEQGNGTGDAVALVLARFQSKPGFIAQIAAEIMSLSGFDEDDVTEKEMVEAAGNS